MPDKHPRICEHNIAAKRFYNLDSVALLCMVLGRKIYLDGGRFVTSQFDQRRLPGTQVDPAGDLSPQNVQFEFCGRRGGKLQVQRQLILSQMGVLIVLMLSFCATEISSFGI